MRHILADLRYAARTLKGAPLFTVLAAASIALGIGANTTIFTLLDQIVLRPLPVERPYELVQLEIDGMFNGNGWGDGSELAYPMYRDFQAHNSVFTGMASPRRCDGRNSPCLSLSRSTRRRWSPRVCALS